MTVLVAIGVACVAAPANAKTGLLCATSAGATSRALKSKPATCITLGATGNFAANVWLSETSWNSWGKATTYGSGLNRGFRKQPAKARLALRAYRLRNCGSGNRVYTRLNVRLVQSPGSRLTIRFRPSAAIELCLRGEAGRSWPQRGDGTSRAKSICA